MHGRANLWLPVLLFIGSVGLWERAHQFSPELGLMLDGAALYGFALALRRPVAGGAAIGLGAGVGLLERGFVAALWISVTAAALPVAFSAWRTRRYARAAGVALALAVVLRGSLAARALAPRAPHLHAWWAAQSPGDFLAPLDPAAAGDATFLLKNLPWFAWPALPLVLWTI